VAQFEQLAKSPTVRPLENTSPRTGSADRRTSLRTGDAVRSDRQSQRIPVVRLTNSAVSARRMTMTNNSTHCGRNAKAGSRREFLARPANLETAQQRAVLDQLANWNRRHAEARPGDSRLEARIANYELAFKMQTSAPELMDVTYETAATQELYGIQKEPTARFGRMCLLARRMVERGVRCVQLVNNDWDGHGECAANHQANASRIDQPIAALLTDLKQRCLLDSTLVVWCGEFGRTPVLQGNKGRPQSLRFQRLDGRRHSRWPND